MTSRTIALTATAALLVALGARALPQDGAPTPEQLEEMTRRWERASRVNQMHEMLGRFVGEWNVKVWAAAGGTPVESEGKSTYRWLIEGRWLAEELDCAVQGRPIQGFGMMGYDNFKGKYVSTWVDDQSTAMLRFEGNLKPEGDVPVLRTYGVMDEPMTGEHDRPVMRVTRLTSGDGHTVQVHDLTRRTGATLVLKIEYSRAGEDDDEKKEGE